MLLRETSVVDRPTTFPRGVVLSFTLTVVDPPAGALLDVLRNAPTGPRAKVPHVVSVMLVGPLLLLAAGKPSVDHPRPRPRVNLPCHARIFVLIARV